MNFSISSNYLNKHTHFENYLVILFLLLLNCVDHINKNIIDNQIEVCINPNTDFYNQLI